MSHSAKIIAAALAGTIGLCSVATAQPRHADPYRGPAATHGHAVRPAPMQARPPVVRPGPRQVRPPVAYQRAQIAYPQYQRFNRGDRLPPQFRQRQYVVNDWRAHRLSAPPRGYQWVQNGSDYVLAAIATGVITAVVINALSK